jgi:hypothetical protein
MNEAKLQDGLGAMLQEHPGVIGCALVDSTSGLVWHRRPDRLFDGVWEASVDHWRLHGRLGLHFDALGELGAIVTYHRDAMLSLIPCLRDPDVLLVCLAEHGKVDWIRWQRDARRLGALIRDAL